jgi:hypothetical protein
MNDLKEVLVEGLKASSAAGGGGNIEAIRRSGSSKIMLR